MKRTHSQDEGGFARLPGDVANIARPESLVMLAATEGHAGQANEFCPLRRSQHSAQQLPVFGA